MRKKNNIDPFYIVLCVVAFGFMALVLMKYILDLIGYLTS